MLSQVRGQGSLSDHIYRAAQEILQVLLESHKVQERAPFFELHKQIEVACPSESSPRAREPKTRTSLAPVAHGQIEDLGAVLLEDGVAHCFEVSDGFGAEGRMAPHPRSSPLAAGQGSEGRAGTYVRRLPEPSTPGRLGLVTE